MSRHTLFAVAELHAARLAMQGAFLALHRAAQEREHISDRDLQTLYADFCGAGEEAAAIAALIDRLPALDLKRGNVSSHGSPTV